MKSWINDCEESHGSCPTLSKKFLPTRVIDVEAEDPNLVLGAGVTGVYVALSHCWGLSDQNPYHLQYKPESQSLIS